MYHLSFLDYKAYIEKYTAENDIDIFDLSASLLKMLNEGKQGDKFIEKDEKSHNDENKVRLFVNLGKMDKMGTNNMIDLLKSGGVLYEQVGKIDIMPKFSLVDVEKEAVDIIIETLNGSFYKKRKILFEVSNKKDKKEDKKQNSKPRKRR